MVLSSRFGKRRFRDALLRSLDFQGDERLLDAGCGKGLLLVGAAHRLPEGLAVGIDLWSPHHQSGNRAESTSRNARHEGVADRVAVVTADMRGLPLHHASFDVVVSNLAVHTIATTAGRAEAVRELARVVRPAGTLAIADFRRTGEVVAALRGLGWTDVRRGRASLWQFPPVRTVLARRPGSAPARHAPAQRKAKAE
jgi:arsenite methyltransferase